MTQPRLELSDMLVGLRAELDEARKKAEEEKLKFKVESIDVEVHVTLAYDAKAEGKAKWKFFPIFEAEAGAAVGGSRETVQTIRLKLTPEADNGPIKIKRKGI